MDSKKELLTLFDPLVGSSSQSVGNAAKRDPAPSLGQPLRVALPTTSTSGVDSNAGLYVGGNQSGTFVAPFPNMLPEVAKAVPAHVQYPNQPNTSARPQPSFASPTLTVALPPATQTSMAPSNVHSLPPTNPKTASGGQSLLPNRTHMSGVQSSSNLQNVSNGKSSAGTKWYDDLGTLSVKSSQAETSANLGASGRRLPPTSSASMQKCASSSNVAAASASDAAFSSTARSGTERKGKADISKKAVAAGLRNSTFDQDSAGSNREERITMKMEERLKDYLVLRDLNVLCATWNVNGQLPTGDLASWLTPWLHERLSGAQMRQLLESPTGTIDKSTLRACDVIVVAFQELDLSVGNALQVFESPREPLWHEACRAAVNRSQGVDVSKSSQFEFERVKSLRLVGILLIVYVRRSLTPFVREICAESVPTGFMSMMGNKGAVAVRMRIGRTTICFVGSHLCAHSEHFESRNQEFRDINARLRFTVLSEDKTTTQQLAINDHHVVFWLGDLNYRLNQFSSEEAKTLISQNNIRKLLENDQLALARAAGKAFNDYQEGDIEFVPTYKFDPGTDNWDSSEKCRVPAFCDRILWRVQPGVQNTGQKVRLLKYASHVTLKLSDHKPVSALFAVQVEEIDRERESRVYQQVLKDIDKEENEMHPSAEVDTHEVNFGEVHYLERLVRNVVLTNKSDRVPFSFCFTPPPRPDADDSPSAICQSWLSIKPTSGRLEPRNSCVLQFEVFINAFLARKMLSQRYELQDLLILHLKGGCDIFLTVSGHFVPSCFGLGLHTLVHVATRVRSVPSAELLEFATVLQPDDRVGDAEDRTSAGHFEPFAPVSSNQLIDVSDTATSTSADSVMLINTFATSPFLPTDADQIHASFRFGQQSARNQGNSSAMKGLENLDLHDVGEASAITLKRIALDDALDKCAYQSGSLANVPCLLREACNAPFSVPKELWLILNMLNGSAMQEPGLFSLPGLHEDYCAIANYLDAGILSSTPVSVHSVVEVLLHFLQALPDSVVPIDKYAKALHVADDAEQSRALISSLPRVNRFVFYYITAFVNKCLEPSNANRNLLDRMTAAQPLGDVLLRAPEAAREDRLDPSVKRARIQKRTAFVAHFLHES